MSLGYTVNKSLVPPLITGGWDDDIWRQAAILSIDQFRPESSDHRPETHVKLFYDDWGIYVIFRVRDRYIRCQHTQYLDPVYLDSCVEWFIQPHPDAGYFNIEINCGGALLVYYIEDPARDTQRRLKKYQKIPMELARQISIFHSLPAVIDPEITESQEWRIELSVPFSFFASFCGPAVTAPGQVWKGNFYKCGNATSHPHWASWSPLGAYDFHRPQDFAPIKFTEKTDQILKPCK